MALRQIPNPYNTPWDLWVDTLVGYNDSLRPNVSPDDPWEEVALRLSEFAPDTPRPEGFRSWQDWAAALKQAYPN